MTVNFATQRIGNHICLVWMIMHFELIIFNQLKPSPLTHVQISLSEKIFETFVVRIDVAQLLTTKRPTNSNMQDACTFYRSHPNNCQLWYTKTTSGTNTYSPYIYTSRSYDQ